MTHRNQFTGGLLALCVSLSLHANVSAATVDSAQLNLMSEAEIAAHTAAMRTLQGADREDYRNAQYEELKKRAQEQGFKLPADPPWAAAATPVAASDQPDPGVAATALPTPPPAGADAAAEAAARHAEMREKLQARREAMQQATEADLNRLKQAANAQQRQVEAQLQTSQESEIQPPDKEVTPTEADLPAPPMAAPVAETGPVDVAPPATAPSATAETEAVPATAADTVAAEPHFAPLEVTAAPAHQPPAPPVPPAPPTPPSRAMPAPAPYSLGSTDAAVPTQPGPVVGSDGQPFATSDATTGYRETMRSRFDQYMQERQAQLEEKARLQREQHEAAMEQNRSMQPNRGRLQPPPYPAMPGYGPGYGPRYPTAYPGYRTPYWQQR